MGHLVRTAAISRAIKSLTGIDALVFIAPGFANIVSKEIPRLEVIEAPEDPGAYRKIILERLRSINPRTLVVDALPMGLMGELRDFLEEFSGRKVLVSRLLRRDYRQMMKIDDFVRANYDLVIRTEKMPDDELKHPRSEQVAPILVRDSAEVFTRTEARKKLAVPRRRILVMAVSTHQPSRADAFFQMVYRAIMRVGYPKGVVKFASPYGDADPSSAHTSYFPLMDLLPGVDLLVAGAGYHSVHEANSLGVPMLAFPEERLYDDQEARVSYFVNINGMTPFHSPQEAEDGLRKFLRSPVPSRRRKKFISGAHEAAKAILELHSS